jgi:hypothetical protein
VSTGSSSCKLPAVLTNVPEELDESIPKETLPTNEVGCEKSIQVFDNLLVVVYRQLLRLRLNPAAGWAPDA